MRSGRYLRRPGVDPHDGDAVAADDRVRELRADFVVTVDGHLVGGQGLPDRERGGLDRVGQLVVLDGDGLEGGDLERQPGPADPADRLADILAPSKRSPSSLNAFDRSVEVTQ